MSHLPINPNPTPMPQYTQEEWKEIANRKCGGNNFKTAEEYANWKRQNPETDTWNFYGQPMKQDEDKVYNFFKKMEDTISNACMTAERFVLDKLGIKYGMPEKPDYPPMPSIPPLKDEKVQEEN